MGLSTIVAAEVFEVTIERILPGGLGMAHADGRTVMVSLAAPGDRLRVRVDKVKGNVSFASIAEIVERSSQRVEPPCPYFGRCGGCDFQQLTYEAQLETKKDIVRDCLRRIGGLQHLPDFEIVPASNPWHYRSRAQWQYDSITQRLGYFESNSRRVCDVAECAVLVPELQETLTALRERMQNGELADDARDFRAVVGDDGISIAPSVSSPTVREGNDGNLITEIIRTIHGQRYHLNAESFFQANNDLLPQLIDAALNESSGEAAVELYCGVGLFTLPLARRFERVIGVEADTAAASFARKNLSAANLANASVANQDVARWLESDGDEFGKVDYLLLDPPRTGAESRVVNGILRLRPQRICYVSCDPATLARDLKKLIAGGYALDWLRAYDMFPQTHHVETLAHLSLASSNHQ